MTIHLPLQTERLLLRDFEDGDWQAVHCYASDPEVARFMVWGPNTEEDTREYIQRKLAEQQAEPRRRQCMALRQSWSSSRRGMVEAPGIWTGGC